MNKLELLTALNEKFHKVYIPVKQGVADEITVYKVLVYDKIDGILRKSVLDFYVENEGDAEEVAYWHNFEPKATPSVTFRDEVNAYIQVEIDAETIEGAFIESIDGAKEIAIVNIVMPDLTEQKRFVDKNISGDLQHRRIL